MDTIEIKAVADYYDAWRNRRGDMSEVPLADDFHFVGPVASFETAAGYREMAGQAGQAVTSFEIRRQFVDGNSTGAGSAGTRRPRPRRYGLMVLTLRGDRVAGLTGFADTAVFASFGLPRTLKD